MMSTHEIAEQTKLAFEFIQKLYLEVSYLIKEVEGLLSNENENFVIGRSGGYAVTGSRSLGLEAYYVSSWPLRKMGVFFVPKQATEYKQGITITRFETDPRIIYLRVVLDEKGLPEPVVIIGVLHSFVGKKYEKVEQMLAHIEYNDNKVFSSGGNLIDYEDGYVQFKGNIIRVNLFDITSSEDITNKLLEPVLKIYRKDI